MAKQTFICWHSTKEDEAFASEIKAYDAEEAAEKYLDGYDGGNEPNLHTSEPVTVKDCEDHLYYFDVSCEAQLVYSAREREPV